MSVKATLGRALSYADLLATTVVAGGTRQTQLAGEIVSFGVRNRMELNRAKNCNGESLQLEWLMKDITDSSVFWDVGAYHGHYSVVAAAKGADVFAFEPHPDNCLRINDNCDRNGVDVQLKRLALSDCSETRRIGGPIQAQSTLGDGLHMVRVMPGDSIEAQPTHVKIDTEGHECAVLDGMETTLEGVQRIMIEVHDGVKASDVIERLRRAGLSATELESDRSQTYIGGVR